MELQRVDHPSLAGHGRVEAQDTDGRDWAADEDLAVAWEIPDDVQGLTITLNNRLVALLGSGPDRQAP